jgi:hypothetical protein
MANFHHLAKRKGLANPTKGFLIKKIFKIPYLKKKKLEVATLDNVFH